MNNRRRFLGSCAAGSVALLSKKCPGQIAAEQADDKSVPPIAIFAKPLEHLEFSELGKRLRAIGVQGIEATLRAGGQIDPENFTNDLGRLIDALAQYQQRVIIAASDINAVSASSEKQLQQFSQVRIPYFRMSYYHYDLAKPILPQLDTFAKQAAELAALCRSLGIRGLYQNHAGKNYVGSALWDLQRMLSEVDPQSMAVALDIRHTALELTQSWQTGCSVIRPHIGAVYVKDFAWVDNKAENVPLGTGVARPVFNQVKKDGIVGPLSLHVEYFDHREASLQEQRWQAVCDDVATLRQWLA